MKIFIIEDNEIEAENLKILLEGFDAYQLLGTADTIKQGIEVANKERPEIIFLDIQLECQNSLEHIDQLDYSPYIICATLHTEHALQAFEVGANDYLTKPITLEKLSRAMNRFTELHNEVAHQEVAQQTIPLHNGIRITMVPIDQVIQITADRDYTVVCDQEDTEYLCSRRMSDWVELLPTSQFILLDRSTIINIQQIDSFSRLSADRTAIITFLNGHTLSIGPTALKRLKSVMLP